MPAVINLPKKPAEGDLALPEGVVSTFVTRMFWRFFDDVAVVDESAPGILRLGVATGRTGIGKSFAARAWAAQNGATYLSLAGEDQVKRNSLLSQLYAALRGGGKVDAYASDNFDFSRGYQTIRSALVPAAAAAERKRLRMLRSPMARRLMPDDPDEAAPAPETVIIDEAQRLTFCGMTVASDLAEAGATVILVGTDTLRDALFNPGRAQRDRRAWAPVISRFSHRLCIPEDADLPIEDDREALARAAGITDRAAIEYLRRLVTSDGALREVARHIARATRAAGGAPVTVKHLQAEVKAWGMKA